MTALPAYQGDTDTVSRGEDWTGYIRRITEGLPRKEIAEAADIHVSGVSRWLAGVSQPSPDKVITFARNLRLSPVEALIAAGYLDDSDVSGVVSVVQSLSEIPDQTLIEELSRRLRERRSTGERPIGARGLRQQPQPGSRATP